MKNGRKLLAASMASVMAMSSVSGTLLSNIGTVAFADVTAETAKLEDLKALITTAEGKIESQFTAESFADLKTAIKSAKAITSESSKLELAAAYGMLQKAIKGLKTHQGAAFDAYKKVATSGDAKVIYDLVGAATLVTGLDTEENFYQIAAPDAIVVRDAYKSIDGKDDEQLATLMATKTVEEWGKETTKLSKAIEVVNANIVLEKVAQVKAYAALQAEIAASKEIVEKEKKEPGTYDKDASEWVKFKDAEGPGAPGSPTAAYDKAVKVAANADTTAINNAAKALKDARAKVVTKLQAAQKKLADELKNSKKVYDKTASAFKPEVKGTWDVFVSQYNAAKALTSTATVEEINATVDALTTTRVALDKFGNRTTEQNIKEYTAKKESNITFFKSLKKNEWAPAVYNAIETLYNEMCNAADVNTLKTKVEAFDAEEKNIQNVIDKGAKAKIQDAAGAAAIVLSLAKGNDSYDAYRSVGYRLKAEIAADAAYNNDFYKAVKDKIKAAEDQIAKATWDDQKGYKASESDNAETQLSNAETLLTNITGAVATAKTKKEAADKLEAYIEFAKDYMDVAAIKTAVLNAEIVLEDATTFAGKIADEIDDLTTAIKTPVLKAMKDRAVDDAIAELKIAVKATKGFVEGDYTAKTWAALNTALNKATTEKIKEFEDKKASYADSNQVYNQVKAIKDVTKEINTAIEKLEKANADVTVADVIANIKDLNTSSVSAVVACAENAVAAIEAATNTTKIQEKAVELLKSTKLSVDDMVKVLQAIALEADTTKPAPTRLAVVQAYTSLNNDGSAVNQLYLAAQGMNKSGAATVTRLDLVQVYQAI